jgi:CubicO group peptidase (beta-lactamase class C family)
VLLAETVRRASGAGFAAWMDRRIFRPLGMDAFVVEPGTMIPSGVARGYDVADDGTVSRSDYSLRTHGPGSIYASIRDLVRWDRELREGRVLSETVRTQMCAPVPFEGRYSPFSPGWIAGEIIRGPLQGKNVQQAFGDQNGFRAGIRRFYEEGITVIWLTNGGRHLFELELAERFLPDGA